MPYIRHFREIMGNNYATVLKVQKTVDDGERKGIPWEKTRGKIDKADYDVWTEMLEQCRRYGWYRPRVVWLDVGQGKEEVLTFMSLYEPGERYYNSPKPAGPTKEEIAKWEREYYGDEEFVKEGNG